jgi:hypothetical protein
LVIVYLTPPYPTALYFLLYLSGISTCCSIPLGDEIC